MYDWSENLDMVTCLEAYVMAAQAQRTTVGKNTSRDSNTAL